MEQKLWYEQPASIWEEALALGNGRLGAMIFGYPQREHVQLNEDSMWYGGPVDRINKDALPNLKKVRELILDGSIPEAEKLLGYAFTGTPQNERPYQSFGDMDLNMHGQDESIITGYKRELSLEEAVHAISYESQGIKYRRESFISKTEEVFVTRLTADKKGSISFDCQMSRGYFYNRVWAVSDDTIAINGNLGDGGIDFCGMIKVIVDGGNVKTIGEHIIVKNADAATIYFTAATTFRNKEPEKACLELLKQAAQYEYKMLKERHISNYQEMFNRVELNLDYEEELDNLPTDQRLNKISKENPDNGLLMLYYQFGRYLLISCSRPGTLPANLQGIWNKDMSPAWGSKFTININTEMNYWPALTCNLSECQEPLFDMIERMVKTGRETARRMYDCRGFVAHHNTDIWADTAPQDKWIPATYWVMGAAWLCTHMWEHYTFTKDKEFLLRAYPTMKEAALFFVDYLIEDKGQLVTCPSVSPENTYILPSGVSGCNCAGATMDNEILRDLFGACIKSSKILEQDEEFAQTLMHIEEKLPPLQIGKHGQIMEWREDYEEAELGHRHISHLYALYPSSQITVDGTPEYAKAARVTLERRLANGGGHTGWSMAWIINMFARLWDGEAAYERLIQLLNNSTLPNLFDNHPPFQIDGNFGAIAGMAEMLVQSTEERIMLLPALPIQWQKGNVKGLRVRGGGIIDLTWEEGKHIIVTLKALSDIRTTLCYGNKNIEVNLIKGEIGIYNCI